MRQFVTVNQDRVLTWAAWFVTAAAAVVAAVSFYLGFGSPQIQLGNVSEGLGALFTFAAAAVALRIATRDRTDRIVERADEAKAHARLIRVTIEPDSRSGLNIYIRNYGPMTALDVVLLHALWDKHPDAKQRRSYGRWIRRGASPGILHQPVLMPVTDFEDKYYTVAEFRVLYLNSEDEFLAEVDPRSAEYKFPNHLPIDLRDVRAAVQFTLADGSIWITEIAHGLAKEPVRAKTPHRIAPTVSDGDEPEGSQ